MTELKKTPLHAIHQAAGARLVDFGGWAMPVHYGSQIDEHHAVRSAAGMFDVSHMCVVDLTGDTARRFLLRALANNVDKLRTPGRALYSCLLNPAGGVIDDLIVYYFRDDFYRLVVNAATADKDLAWLGTLNAEGEFGVSITPRRDLSIIAVQGPQARARVWQAAPSLCAATETLKPFNAALVADTPFGAMTIARTGYTGEDGFELIVPSADVVALWQALAATGVRACGLGARDTLRLEAGMNLYGQDMDDNVSPLDAGLAWTVDMSTPRDFIGRGALEAAGQRASFAGLLLRDAGGVLRAHQPVLRAGGAASEVVGELTSGTFSPSLQRSIGFARLDPSIAVGATVEVLIRGKRLAATVVKLPFVRIGQVLVDLPH